ncbi:DM13 domain-containing protein [Streptomyces sp. CC228A]|uniref:DM13 domain-containing protein n=1 Tax=Streptomyces sp. CC228A TaxID=2898186 RepID=UPI0035A8F70B
MTHEHGTTGTVSVLRLPDGSQVLRLEDLDTSNGPDLKVWVTDAPVIEGKAAGASSTTARTSTSASSRATRGDQNYALPASFDVRAAASASQCDRFDVVLRRGRAGEEGVTHRRRSGA